MKTLDLLSTTSRVEAPFIKVSIGDYTFGTYDKFSSSIYDENGFKQQVYNVYPNFVKSLNIVKINGQVNTYTLNLTYAVKAGDDPNLIDKILGKVSRSRKIKFSYGDCAAPTHIFKEETAVITKVRTTIDVNNAIINYVINATSDALALKAGKYNFPAKNAKPSDEIKSLLYNNSYGLLEIFYGMRDKELVEQKNLIASNDKKVHIEAKSNISILDYLMYLVKCMSNVSDTDNALTSNTRYIISVFDDYSGIDNMSGFDTFAYTLGGPYFKVTEVIRDAKGLNSIDAFEVNIGYPSENGGMITSFSIDDDQTYSLLYDYSKGIGQTDFSYRINDDGKIESFYSPIIATSDTLYRTTEEDKTWWSQVTGYPIKATLTMKGLVRPAILMTYVKLNYYFWGRKHLSSGTYIVTKQQDTVDSSGYRTTLSLTRILGDDELQ